ncbi:MAG: FAD-binding oxidoreductase [Pseudomonadota bacterium]
MNKKNDTLSKRRPLRFWGWGYADENLDTEEESIVDFMASTLLPTGGSVFVQEPVESEYELLPPRITAPSHLQSICSSHRYDRLVHCYGKSFPDLARMFMRSVPNAPDLVAFPKSEEQVCELLRFAENKNIAVIPYGGGTSVCGGVEAAVGEGYAGTICIDMQGFNQVLDVDEVSRSAKIQAGMLGPNIDDALKAYDLTLRHFPQSYQFSTLGGWIATRAGGHFATLYTHIDDLVESVRIVTPRGTMETRRLPGSGAGPSPDRMLIGSEGIYGLITEASVRLQNRPRWKGTASVFFDTFEDASEGVRAVSQSGLYPTNCRLLDADEALLNRVSEAGKAILVLGFESADHPVNPAMERALDIVRSHGGEIREEDIEYQDHNSGTRTASSEEAATWKHAFIRIPYYKNRFIQHGLIADTFETAITWERLPDFYAGLKQEMAAAIEEISGHKGFVSCRFTHVYPDGPCVYITFIAVGSTRGDMQEVLDTWCQVKALANRSVIERGGTITHHHAVGRDHRNGYEQQMPELYLATLESAKATVDPKGIMNPGVLIDPKDRTVGVTGALKEYV